MQIFHDNLWKQREEQYLATMNRYGKEERMKMAGMLILTYEKGLGDVLGEVYMESIGGNKNSGQFFTPYSVSLATARLTLPDTIDENKKLSLCEPTCGSGGMVIFTAPAARYPPGAERFLNEIFTRRVSILTLRFLL